MRSFGIAKPSLGACHRDFAFRRSPRVAIVGEVRDGRRPPRPCHVTHSVAARVEAPRSSWNRLTWSTDGNNTALKTRRIGLCTPRSPGGLEPGLGSGKT